MARPTNTWNNPSANRRCVSYKQKWHVEHGYGLDLYDQFANHIEQYWFRKSEDREEFIRDNLAHARNDGNVW